MKYLDSLTGIDADEDDADDDMEQEEGVGVVGCCSVDEAVACGADSAAVDAVADVDVFLGGFLFELLILSISAMSGNGSSSLWSYLHSR